MDIFLDLKASWLSGLRKVQGYHQSNQLVAVLEMIMLNHLKTANNKK
jgi:hypothetical protein